MGWDVYAADMMEGAGRQARLAAELAEWQEDLWRAHTGSRIVLVRVPAGWGHRPVLDEFAAGIDALDDVPVTLTVRIDSQAVRALETAGLQSRALARMLQVQVLRADLGEAADQHRVMEQLGLDKRSGQAQLAVSAIGLLFSGVTAGVSVLGAVLAAGALGKAWDDSPAGQDGVLARSARAVAKVSVDAPVTVIIDDADCLDEGLAVTLAENLTARQGSQVLLVAVVDPGSALPAALRSRVRQGLSSGLVYDAEADPDMGYESRLELARQLSPNLPDAGARRIAQRTTTFAEVFTVAAAPRLTDFGHDSDRAEVLAVVDAAASVRPVRPAPSPEAAVIAWAGGLVHARQANRALGILGASREEGDPDVRRWESLERLADPAAPGLAGQVAAGLTGGQRRDMAAAFLQEALTLTQDPGASLVGTVAALQAAHRVRGDLPAPGQLPRAQRELVAALEALGDYPGALDVADIALDEWPADDPGFRAERVALAAEVIRLSDATPHSTPGPLAGQLIAEAAEGGAAAGLEARVWAAVVLLDTPGQREAALSLAGEVTDELESRTGLGTAGDRWRLLLAYRAGRADLPDLTARLLAPLVTSADPDVRKSALVVRRAVDGPGADIRLQNILLEAELAALPARAEDDRLRVHHALAANYDTLGGYHQALAHGQHELSLRTSIQGPRHPDTLITRARVARWTGRCGDVTAALRLSRELLPDMEEVLGPRHPTTLTARGHLAYWTGQCGDVAAALRLYRELLPGMEKVLGPRHPTTLTTRGNIARWTGQGGDVAAALRLFRELLADQDEVLGSRHPDTLTTRSDIARWTGQGGEAAAALRLFRELLPGMEEAFGPRHADTVTARSNIAYWTGQCGDVAGALCLYRELLPGVEEVLGPRHFDTLITRANIAAYTGQGGDAAAALRLYRELLADREQVLGPRHPDTLATRAHIAYWTSQCGDVAAALRLFRELLPDMEEVLGPRHPDTLATRANIAACTGQGGDAAAGS